MRCSKAFILASLDFIAQALQFGGQFKEDTFATIVELFAFGRTCYGAVVEVILRHFEYVLSHLYFLLLVPLFIMSGWF